MAGWLVRQKTRDPDGTESWHDYSPENLKFSIKNSIPGDISYELPMGEPTMTMNEFGPYRTDYSLYRVTGGGTSITGPIVEGMITQVNLNDDRDTVQITGKDWLHYLQRRIYPFDPIAYRSGDWENWPKHWPNVPADTTVTAPDAFSPVELRDIVQDIIRAMEEGPDSARGILSGTHWPPLLPGMTVDDLPGGPIGQLGVVYNNKPTGQTTKYTIMPADNTSIFDHIDALSQKVDGFEFDIIPGSREFKMWYPDRRAQTPTYLFAVQNEEQFGAVTNLDWTNEGPEGTYIIGLGSSAKKAGAIWYYQPSIRQYRWLDQLVDFGEIRYTALMELGGISVQDILFQKTKNNNSLYPQRKTGISLLNPEFLTPNFYTGGRPRNVVGRTVTINHTFDPYWHLAATTEYRVMGINWDIDQSGNETVDLELDLIYDEHQPTALFIP